MNQKTIIALVLAVLVVVSLVQAFQLYGLREKVKSGGLKVGSSPGTVAVASAGSGRTVGAVPSSVKELPSMVGGC